MLDGPFASFILASLVGFVLAIGTLFLGKKSGLGNVQATLIDTLQDNAAALDKRVILLEREIELERQQRIHLEGVVSELRNTVTDLANENTRLRMQLSKKPAP
jgi:hypothetical protein